MAPYWVTAGGEACEERCIVRMEELAEQYGFDSELVDVWAEHEGETLLPLQERVLGSPALNGADTLIIAPTSSGKTFAAELLALKATFDQRRTIMLVPLKAIAEEKFDDFATKYSPLKIRVVVSTRDRRTWDDDILHGDYDIAIVVFEKMSQLLVQSPSLLQHCGLVVVDELQMIADSSRGEDLEILLTQLLVSRDAKALPFQILGLSATIAELNGLDAWLGTEVIREEKRPVELSEGILLDSGRYRFREHNSGQEGDLQLLPPVEPPNEPVGILQEVVSLVSALVDDGHQVIVFRKWKSLTRDTARALADALPRSSDPDLLAAIREGEATESRDLLTKTLRSGVAFHNADLTPEERAAVQGAFTKPGSRLRVVCGTTTLALGVNLPASAVVIADRKLPDSGAAGFNEIDLPVSDYKNMAGRAGRLGYAQAGMSILIAGDANTEILWRTYVCGEPQRVCSRLHQGDLRTHILRLLSSGTCRARGELEDFLLRTYAGHLHWSLPAAQDAFAEGVQDGIDQLVQAELLERAEGQELCATALGRVCATSGCAVDCFVTLVSWLRWLLDVADWDDWHAIFAVSHCPDVCDIPFRLSTPEFRAGEPFVLLDGADIPYESACERSLEQLDDDYEVMKRVKVALVLTDWTNGVVCRDIERQYFAQYPDKAYSGTIRAVADAASWMLEIAADVAHAWDLSSGLVERLQTLARRLRAGVPAEGLQFADLHLRGLNRDAIQRLVEAGFDSLDKALDADLADFDGVLPRRTAQRLREAGVSYVVNTEQRHRRNQELRLEAIGHDASTIGPVYDAQGCDFEMAIEALLGAAPLSLPIMRVASQKRGEPDLLLDHARKRAVIGATASEAEHKKISDSKAMEIFRSAVGFSVDALIVVGRPDFHELAIEKAPGAAKEFGKSYKLIPASVLAELYVLAAEEALDTEGVLRILLDETGYIDMQRLRRLCGERFRPGTQAAATD